MNQTDLFVLSRFIPGHTKAAGAMGSALFRGLGRAGMEAAEGARALRGLPGRLFQGGSQIAERLGRFPNWAANEMRAGFRGAPVFNRNITPPPFVSGQFYRETAGAPGGIATYKGMPYTPPSNPNMLPVFRGSTPGARASSRLAEETMAGAGGAGAVPPGVGGAGAAGSGGGWIDRFGNLRDRFNGLPPWQRGAAIGGGVYGAKMLQEAPGKAHERAVYQWQQQHPFISGLGRLLGVMPQASNPSYLMPNLLQGRGIL